jgi:hypothetical protein
MIICSDIKASTNAWSEIYTITWNQMQSRTTFRWNASPILVAAGEFIWAVLWLYRDSKDAVLFTCKADCVDKISKYAVLSHAKWGPWTESQNIHHHPTPNWAQFFFPLITFQKQSLARDNLSTRQKLEDLSCLFCSDIESVNHSLFECAVATKLWNIISDIIGFSCGQDFLSIAKLWLSNKNFVAIIVNYICCPIGLWKLRNSLLF